jgi:hypothetical protein
LWIFFEKDTDAAFVVSALFGLFFNPVIGTHFMSRHEMRSKTPARFFRQVFYQDYLLGHHLDEKNICVDIQFDRA